MLDEAEVDAGLVSRAEAVCGHVDDGGGLADGAAVHHGLVPVGKMGKNSIKITLSQDGKGP